MQKLVSNEISFSVEMMNQAKFDMPHFVILTLMDEIGRENAQIITISVRGYVDDDEH
jgi:hypothetical protein